MGRAGVHRVRSHFTWQTVTERLAEVYAGVVDRSAIDSELPPALPASPREARAGMALQ